MKLTYPPLTAYASVFDSSKLFRHRPEAEAFDRGWAAGLVGRMSESDLLKAVADGDLVVSGAMRYLADQATWVADLAGAAPLRSFR